MKRFFLLFKGFQEGPRVPYVQVLIFLHVLDRALLKLDPVCYK